MDLSLLNDEAMDDSFLVIRAEAMDDEVTQIFKKWKLNNPLPKKDVENINSVNIVNNETFDSRTFTRPAKRRTFNISDSNTPPSLQSVNSEMQSMESGIASINLQVGGTFTPLSMQRSWLNDVSPPSSICTSMDFQNNDTMLNSLITSSDFTNISFLSNMQDNLEQTRRLNNANIVNNNNRETPVTSVNNNPNNISQNLMNFTFDVNKTITNNQPNATFVGRTFVAAATTTDSESIKEIGIENADMQLNVSTEDVGKNLTFNKYENGNITWEKVQDLRLSNGSNPENNVVQSTPVHNHPENDHKNKLRKNFDDTISPISSLQAQNSNNNNNNADDDDDEILLRNIKGRKLVNDITMEDYRNSIEDQCEFLLNEETIKLSTRVCGESFECLNDLRNALITSADANEKEFDEMLDTFNVQKSRESEKLLQSVDSIKQRHSLINMEKQKEDKRQKKDCENDNRTQYDVMNKSSERLLNRRSRLFDDVNLQLQKQQNEASMNGNGNESGSVHHNLQSVGIDAENEDNEVIDKNDRDRFKTIKLNRPRLQKGMVIVDTQESEEQQQQQSQIASNEVSPGSNKERRNQINQQKQQEDESEFKKPPAMSKLSKFGFSRPTYRSRNDLNLPLKANSTDSLDNDTDLSTNSKKTVSNLKSPMGIKSKSIHNLMYNGSGSSQNGIRMSSNLKLYPETTRSQSNLKGPRASSLVRPVDNNFKVPQSFQPRAQPTNRKTAGLVRPSSGYYGNGTTKRLDSDNESYSLSSSSASSRNSVHLSLAPEQQLYQQNSTEELDQPIKKPSGAIPKPGIARPMSGLPRPQVKSGLPRPKR
ncbi:hypothetical protein ACKWTF_000315 [Chironomus riparius]